MITIDLLWTIDLTFYPHYPTHKDIVQVVVVNPSLLGTQEMVPFNPDVNDTLFVNTVSPMATWPLLLLPNQNVFSTVF